MQSIDNAREVQTIMLDFAVRTGLTNHTVPPRRYLWTDAHAVCTFLGLYRETGDAANPHLATMLIDQVHDVLGRHRDDDPRDGWISGLSEAEGREHPTAGGLRIGKKLSERRRSEPLDENLEWDRDGQYFHYLTKWMHALCRAGTVLDDARYVRWSRELAQAAIAGFVVAAPGGGRLYWKMSIDMTYPLVASSGHHDPLDGYVTCHEIAHSGVSGLGAELTRLAGMMAGQDWATIDPLGIGGLLFDACRVVQLTAAGQMDGSVLATMLVKATRDSLDAWSRGTDLLLPAGQRLAFRELGLSIGLHAVDLMMRIVDSRADLFGADIQRELRALERFVPLSGAIEDFWQRPGSRQAKTWREHADINAVTLATSLLPEQFLLA